VIFFIEIKDTDFYKENIHLQLLCDDNSMLENLGSMNIDDVSVGL